LVPFELLLLAYGILGPLHYLTEISWLHDRHYFTNGRGSLALWALAVVGVLPFLALWVALALVSFRAPLWQLVFVLTGCGLALLLPAKLGFYLALLVP